MNGVPGVTWAASGPGGAVRTTAGRAWHGLVQVLAGLEPPPAWHWRSPQERRAAYVALGLATLALCVVNAGTVHGVAALHATLSPSADTIQLPPVLKQRLLAAVVVVPLPLAAWYPTLAWRAGWLALLLSPLVPAHWWGGWPWGPPQILALLAAFALAGVRHQRPALWWMWTLSLIPWLAWLTADIPDLKGPASATLVFTTVAVAADSLGSRLRTQRALAAQTQRAETEQARRAVLEERARIARELHDVVAHHMSLVAVQAETAPYRLTGLPEPVRAEFSSLSQVAREALADMRRLLGVFRQDQPADLAPQPQLADIPALVDATRRAGVSVEFSPPPALGQVPSGVGVCAYRIVQESLSNASQHAPGAPITVSVAHDSGAVRLRVANGPASTPGPPGNEPRHGHGLTGMRERVALLGGSLTAGPAPDGGFVVAAVLPLGDTP
ncbi:MAG TPA: sensor histidine kinase [Streptosporangiaceae bacterium]|nr:sensor histidine kinase [Streptosporangiaceae bacterium]